MIEGTWEESERDLQTFMVVHMATLATLDAAPASWLRTSEISLDPDLSDYYGSMTIEQTHDLTYGLMTILRGRLADQCALIGVLNSLHDIGYPILVVEYRGDP